MPIDIKQTATASGHKTIRTLVSGVLTTDEAKQYVDAFSANGPHFGKPNCGVLAPNSEISADSRKILGSLKPECWPVASVVVPSMALRMVTTFMIRIIGHSNIKIFGTEPEAMAWMDTAIPEQMKKSAQTQAATS